MKDKKELLDRYKRQMVKYLTYENSKRAEADLDYLINEEFKNGYSIAELEDFLQGIGSPYSFSLQYESKSNIFISGKNYEIFIKFMKLMAVDVIIAVAVVMFIMGGEVTKTQLINSVKMLIVTIFVTVTLSCFISERVKNTRIMSSLIKDFKIEELYNKSKKKIDNPKNYLFVIFFGFFIFISLLYAQLNENYVFVKVLQIILFMLILRDVSRISEVYYGKFITTLSVITDVGSLVLLSLALRKHFSEGVIRSIFLLLLLTIAVDLITTLKNRHKNQD